MIEPLRAWSAVRAAFRVPAVTAPPGPPLGRRALAASRGTRRRSSCAVRATAGSGGRRATRESRTSNPALACGRPKHRAPAGNVTVSIPGRSRSGRRALTRGGGRDRRRSGGAHGGRGSRRLARDGRVRGTRRDVRDANRRHPRPSALQVSADRCAASCPRPRAEAVAGNVIASIRPVRRRTSTCQQATQSAASRAGERFREAATAPPPLGLRTASGRGGRHALRRAPDRRVRGTRRDVRDPGRADATRFPWRHRGAFARRAFSRAGCHTCGLFRLPLCGRNGCLVNSIRRRHLRSHCWRRSRCCAGVPRGCSDSC